MIETRRLIQAASALSKLLRDRGVPHAFYGSLFTALVANIPHCDEIFCVIQGNDAHPFRLVREAVANSEDFTTTHSPWTSRLHVTYRRLIPPVEIEILPAGEHGPRHLDATTTTRIHEIPFLTVSEFVRAKLKTWVIRGSERDAYDITYVVNRFWDRVDINRINEEDMKQFVSRNNEATPGWTALQQKYGM